jgi:hypothetical protein
MKANELREIRRLSTLVKYVSDNPKVIDSIFLDHKIRFTQPAALNDPVEFNPAIRFNEEGNNFKRYKYQGEIKPSIHDWYHRNLIESRINQYGVLSLTDNPSSFEMWCNYANGHRGILIEFNIPDKTRPTLQLTEELNLKVYKVRYVKDYIVNIDKLDPTGTFIPFYKIRNSIFLRKTKHWKYEREYRIVRPLSECEDYQSPITRNPYRDNQGIYRCSLSLSCIANIVFGVNTTPEIKRKIIDSCRNTKINFLQTIIYKDLQNKIDFRPIDEFGSVDEYLKKEPRIFTFDSIMAKYYGDYITVNSLAELPYQHPQPEDIEKYHRKQLKKKGS